MIFLIALLGSFASATTLLDAVHSALKHHESVGQAHERVVQAKERLDQAKSGPQPNLSLNASYLVQPPLSNPLFREFSPERQTTAQVTLAQPLFRGFREFAALRQTRDFLDAAKAGEYQALAQLYEMVAMAYLQVLSFEQDLINLNELRDIYSQRVKDLTGRARRGESMRNEPLTAQSTAATTLADIELRRAELRTARENFSFLTGLPLETKLTDSVGEQPPRLESVDYYLKRVESRPDIVIAKKNVEAADEGVRLAKGTHWPTIDAIGNYYLKRPDGFLSDLDWDVKFQLSLPLYEGGLRVSQTAEAASKKRELELELARLRRLAAADIRSLHEALVIHARRLDALKRSTELSRSNSRLLERDFRRGLMRNIDVQAAVAEYGIVRRNFDQARFDARLALIRLERAANILPPPISNPVEGSKP